MANLGRRVAGAEKNAASKIVQGNWNTIAPISLATGATVATELTWDNDTPNTPSNPVLTLILTPDNDVYIDFASSTTDVIVTANAHVLSAGESYEIDVPWGEAVEETKNSVYLQLQRVNAVATSVKVVKG
jgi:hypothetical protein